jgi:arylsulfatase A-like enzyme
VVASLAALVWFWRAPRPDPSAGPALDVWLVTVDTLRADALGAYGHQGADTPWIDRLAAAGVRFEQAHAHNVLTLPSHANLLTGRYPFQHGVRDNAGFRFPASLDTLATLLRARGYRTGAFVSAFPLDSRFGLARGFDTYDDELPAPRPGATFLEPERAGSETVQRALRFLAARDARPTFLWLHIYEPHFPYDSGVARFATRPYDGDVAAADASLGPLLAPLLARGAQGGTVVVLTADHGEALGEHGEATHGLLAYEGTLRVPLLLYAPGLLTARVVDAHARHVDVVPTVFDLLGLPQPAGLAGRSLVPLARGATETHAPASYFEALAGALQRGWAPITGLIEGQHKYIEGSEPELYDLRADPSEAVNLATRAAKWSRSLQAQLRTLHAWDGRPASVEEDAEARARLASLGYLASTRSARDPPGVARDPRQQIALEQRLHEIVSLTLDGQQAAALARARSLTRAEPGMAVAFVHLAQLEHDTGNLPAAIAALRHVLALGAGDTRVVARLAAYLTEAGQARAAAALLEPYARQVDPDLDVLTTHALALARAGEGTRALAVLARARALDPSQALLWVHTGTVQLLLGDRANARAAFENATRQAPSLATAWSALGLLALEDGHREEGLALWRRALALDERQYTNLLAAGLQLARTVPPAGRACIELFAEGAPSPHYDAPRARARAWLAAH